MSGLSIYFYAILGPVSTSLHIYSQLLVTQVSIDLAILVGFIIHVFSNPFFYLSKYAPMKLGSAFYKSKVCYIHDLSFKVVLTIFAKWCFATSADSFLKKFTYVFFSSICHSKNLFCS